MLVSSKSNQRGRLHFDNCLMQWVSTHFTPSSMNPQAKEAFSPLVLPHPQQIHALREHRITSLPLCRSAKQGHESTRHTLSPLLGLHSATVMREFLGCLNQVKNINLPFTYSVCSSSDEHRCILFFFCNEIVSPVQTTFA